MKTERVVCREQARLVFALPVESATCAESSAGSAVPSGWAALFSFPFASGVPNDASSNPL